MMLSNRSVLPNLLIIDDSVENLRLMSSILEEKYIVKLAKSGEKGLEIAKSQQPDLILLDVVMEGMDGYEVCTHLKRDAKMRDIPVIFLTALNEVRDEAHGLELGAVDYIHKPASPPIVLARVATQLALKSTTDQLRQHNDNLEIEVLRRTEEIEVVQDATILLAAALAETRDYETGNHLLRTQNYIKAIADTVIDHPRFRNQLNSSIIRLLFKSAPLHDIGKVGIPDSILLKPGKLTDEEFITMKTHTVLGWKSIEQMEKMLSREVDFLRFAKEISRHHHEKWDGSGYPDGLSGDEIPLSARLMAIADVYDALISARVYKPAFSSEEALRIIADGAGRHFDPDLVRAFIGIRSNIEAIAARYRD